MEGLSFMKRVKEDSSNKNILISFQPLALNASQDCIVSLGVFCINKL
jgi:hypothetical protein